MAKASFTSTKEISSQVNPALFSASGAALTGAMVNHSGATSASAKETILPMGLIPDFSPASFEPSNKAEAPSFKVLALAAVIVPVGEKAGLREGILEKSTFLNSSSSLITRSAPFL